MNEFIIDSECFKPGELYCSYGLRKFFRTRNKLKEGDILSLENVLDVQPLNNEKQFILMYLGLKRFNLNNGHHGLMNYHMFLYRFNIIYIQYSWAQQMISDKTLTKIVIDIF